MLNALLTVLAVVAATNFVVMGIFYGNFLLQTRNSGPFSAARAARAAVCVLQGGCCSLFLLSLHGLRPFRRALLRLTAVPASRERPPVILIHPALGNAFIWIVYEVMLRRAGYGTLFFFEYSCRETSLVQTGKRLASLVDAVAEGHPGHRPLLLGASMGGLLARAALCHVKDAPAGLVTLVCPHRGSTLSRFVPGTLPLLRAIWYNSPMVQGLEALERETRFPDLPRVSLYTPMDELLLPAGAARLPQEQTRLWKEARLAPISHITAMAHLPTVRQVMRELDALARR